MLKFMAIQNQLLLGVLQNIYCLKYRKTFVLDFPVVLKKRLRHSYFPVKLAKFFNNIFFDSIPSADCFEGIYQLNWPTSLQSQRHLLYRRSSRLDVFCKHGNTCDEDILTKVAGLDLKLC